MIVQTNSYEETEQLAAELAKFIKPGSVITLAGDLGAGKTTFARGFAKGLQVTEKVKSPTFTLLKIYETGRIPLYHMDVYRLEDSDGEEGLDEYIYGDGVAIIEWAQFIEEDLPSERLTITMKHINESAREIQLKALGNSYEELIDNVMKNIGEN